MSRRRVGGLAVGFAVAAIAGAASMGSPARAETLESALMQAYQNNPTLNSQRAAVRATDENVPTALAGYRPQGDRHGEWRRAVAILDYAHQSDARARNAGDVFYPERL